MQSRSGNERQLIEIMIETSSILERKYEMYKATRNTLERKFLLRKEEVRIILEEYKKRCTMKSLILAQDER